MGSTQSVAPSPKCPLMFSAVFATNSTRKPLDIASYCYLVTEPVNASRPAPVFASITTFS